MNSPGGLQSSAGAAKESPTRSNLRKGAEGSCQETDQVLTDLATGAYPLAKG